GVLFYAFSSKREKVNYRLDLNRLSKTKLTLPFRAKNSPTPRSKFSHPNVVIILTLLSYYCGGLNNNNFFIIFSYLLNSNQA
ncbi:hypothetical protein K469DRAFT_547373, partial [Zopfia rhizophila CBS 207.26]